MSSVLSQQTISLKALLSSLKQKASLEERRALLGEWPVVKEYLRQSPLVEAALLRLSPESQTALLALIAVGQGPLVIRGFDGSEASERALAQLVEILLEVQSFYADIGGIVGYHITLVELIASKETKERPAEYLHPLGHDLIEESAERHRAVRWGIECLPQMAEIYPVGGAGDRLNLIEESSGEPLPAAQLPFCGFTLLEGLMRDLQAREYLYYKLCAHQEVTPVAMMTSQEKNNDQHIRAICASKEWFGRPIESFKLFKQPLVPVITEEGYWAVSEPLKLILKPGGHGVLWKLMEEKGVFDWLKAQEREKSLVRQINNPVAGCDYGLLALSGIGCREKKVFGFASCPRLPKTAEGMNVLIETKEPDGFAYCLTNIEYTEFEAKGIEDRPCSDANPYSVYPANTNILFADLSAVRAAARTLPIPGKLVNMKNRMPCLDAQGETKCVAAGRLESTMQNIADAFVDRFKTRLSEDQNQLRAFITYNSRRKTLAVTKSIYKNDGPFVGTPEGCLFEMMGNGAELLRDHCGMVIPDLQSEREYLEQGPSLFFLFHPALGPLYSVIAQKIHGGVLRKGSELQLEIAELDLVDLDLQGSLLIEAEAILGKRDVSGLLFYGPEGGKCTLRNVKVVNRGIDRQATQFYWKNQIERHEELRIKLRGNGEFFAQDVTFVGRQQIEVPDGHRLTAIQEGDQIRFLQERIAGPTWHWAYRFGQDDRIVLDKNAH